VGWLPAGKARRRLLLAWARPGCRGELHGLGVRVFSSIDSTTQVYVPDEVLDGTPQAESSEKEVDLGGWGFTEAEVETARKIHAQGRVLTAQGFKREADSGMGVERALRFKNWLETKALRWNGKDGFQAAPGFRWVKHRDRWNLYRASSSG
jgi:hypothetical protein